MPCPYPKSYRRETAVPCPNFFENLKSKIQNLKSHDSLPTDIQN